MHCLEAQAETEPHAQYSQGRGQTQVEPVRHSLAPIIPYSAYADQDQAGQNSRSVPQPVGTGQAPQVQIGTTPGRDEQGSSTTKKEAHQAGAQDGTELRLV